MSLAVYTEANPAALLTASNPFVATFDGRVGGTVSHRVYIRNDDTNRYYTDIRIQAVDTSDTNIVDGSTLDFFWKVAEKDINPTPEEWDLLDAGNQLTMSADLGDTIIGDIVTFLPVWVRIRTPRGLNIQTITDVVLRIDATENVITNG